MSELKRVLTIAGSDSSGGAGIQADLKTMMAHGVYGMSAITALTAQNTTGVYGVQEADPDFLAQQIDCVFTDIRPDAVKIGMVSSAAIAEVIAAKLTAYKAQHIVCDPVMVATSGSALIKGGTVDTLVTKLLPLAEVVTPNIPEAEVLCGFAIETAADMERAAAVIAEKISGSVLIKGGHCTDNADDLLYSDGKAYWYRAERIDNENNHGTGCTLSSAIASNLALGYSVPEAVSRAKAYITAALRDGLNLGAGCGPLNHGFAFGQPEYK